MNKIQISTKIQKAVKTKTHKLIDGGNRVLIEDKVNLKGNKIVLVNHVGPDGVYCNNDEFYSWDKF